MPRLQAFLPGAGPARTQPDPAYHPDDILGRPALTIGGTAYYPISTLAAALSRTPGTIREWERTQVIPRGYVINPGSRNGQRRLYTRAQITMLSQLAGECGILDDPRATVKGSEFSRLAHLLFDRLREETP